MRVVVDTNVLISAALKAESSPRYALRWVERQGILLKSEATEEELRRTIAKPRLFRLLRDTEYLDHLMAMLAAAELVQTSSTIEACSDSDDDKFLELAVDGKAEVIVSGDAALLQLSPFCGIPIIPPTVFVRGKMP